MEQPAEFVGARSQATVTDATDRGRVVGHDRHRELHLCSVPPFVAQLPRAPAHQAGNNTFDHRPTVACSTGQLHLAGSAFAVQIGGGKQLIDGLGRQGG